MQPSTDVLRTSLCTKLCACLCGLVVWEIQFALLSKTVHILQPAGFNQYLWWWWRWWWRWCWWCCWSCCCCWWWWWWWSWCQHRLSLGEWPKVAIQHILIFVKFLPTQPTSGCWPDWCTKFGARECSHCQGRARLFVTLSRHHHTSFGICDQRFVRSASLDGLSSDMRKQPKTKLSLSKGLNKSEHALDGYVNVNIKEVNNHPCLSCRLRRLVRVSPNLFFFNQKKTRPCSIWRPSAGYNFQVEQSDGRGWPKDANSFGAMSRCARAHLFDGVGHWAFRSFRWYPDWASFRNDFLLSGKQSNKADDGFGNRWCVYLDLFRSCVSILFLTSPKNRRSEHEQSASNIRWVLSVLRLVR